MKVKTFQRSRSDFERRGHEIYEGLKEELEGKLKGKIVAIEVDSGDYFIGETVVEAIKRAEKEYPEELFYIVRIGYPAVYVKR